MEARDMFGAMLRHFDQKSQEVGRFIETERRLERRIEQLEPELKATIEKLGEWAEYAATLRAMLKERRVLDEKLPRPPGPVELPIPF